jgi:tRNA 2-(methylsulfanyl)-N6-isopentenyladenosine37 hydroxylase
MPLIDRLMISSLIEARSCERFKLLGDAVEDDHELQKLYRGLWGRSTGIT